MSTHSRGFGNLSLVTATTEKMQSGPTIPGVSPEDGASPRGREVAV